MDFKKSVVAINVSVFLLMIGVGLIVALLPRRMMDLSASVSEVGMLAGAYAIPNILLQIPIGKLADRYGFKRFIVCGYLLCGLSGLLYYVSGTPSLYYLGRFLQGVAEVPIWALAPALLSVQYAARKGRHMGLYNASLHCGLTVGGLLSIVAARLGLVNTPFLLFSATSLIGALITALFVENPDRRSHDRQPVDAAGRRVAVLANRSNAIVLAGILLYGAGYGIFITIVPAFLISAKNAAEATIGVFFTLFYIAISIAQLFAGRWSDQHGRKPVMIAGLAMMVAGIAVFPRLPFPGFIVSLAAASLGLGMFCVASMAFLNDRVGENRKGMISGTFFFCWAVGYFLGPLLLGKAGSSIGFPAGFVLLAGLMLIQFFAALLLVERQCG